MYIEITSFYNIPQYLQYIFLFAYILVLNEWVHDTYFMYVGNIIVRCFNLRGKHVYIYIFFLRVCVYVCVCMCVCVCIGVYVCVYVCVYIYTRS